MTYCAPGLTLVLSLIMPSKNRIKEYVEGGIYYIYIRGLDRKELFRDEEDFEFYLNQLERYLTPYKTDSNTRFKTERPYIVRHKQEMSLNGEVFLLAFCLMPDHIHLLIRQINADGMTELMRRVGTNYVMHYNMKYHRSGTLFENGYRAVKVDSEEQIIHLSRFIHRNSGRRKVQRFGPVETITGIRSEEYMYSSYRNFVYSVNSEWLTTNYLLSLFEKLYGNKWKNYHEFVEDLKVNFSLKPIIIDPL